MKSPKTQKIHYSVNSREFKPSLRTWFSAKLQERAAKSILDKHKTEATQEFAELLDRLEDSSKTVIVDDHFQIQLSESPVETLSVMRPDKEYKDMLAKQKTLLAQQEVLNLELKQLNERIALKEEQLVKDKKAVVVVDSPGYSLKVLAYKPSKSATVKQINISVSKTVKSDIVTA